jgi:ubiquinone/menaquinone biosynthesis C-methylase UbiE
MLKEGVKTIEKKGLRYIIENGNKIKRYNPWLGESFSFLYDSIMKNSILPKKFGADVHRHFEILRRELEKVHGKHVLELATGSGSAVGFLNRDNQYTGTDISPGLLRRAKKKFTDAGFKDAAFYVASAEDLPFDDNIFDLCLCILSLNFFNNIAFVFQEIKRVLKSGAVFICSVPVPERNERKRTIRGTLRTEKELRTISQDNDFRFERIPPANGALLYFRAFSVQGS